MLQNCDFSFPPTNPSELSLASQLLHMKLKKYINSFVPHLRDSLTFYFLCFHFLPLQLEINSLYFKTKLIASLYER